MIFCKSLENYPVLCRLYKGFRQRLSGLVMPREWNGIEPMTRMDMQSRLEQIVPLDADLSRLVINPTSGTTGHPIPAPNHPASVGCYDPMIQYALRMNGLFQSCTPGLPLYRSAVRKRPLHIIQCTLTLMVLFKRIDGGIVNSIDISGIVRLFPVYFFRFIQRSDF